jgi:hypothetical protein
MKASMLVFISVYFLWLQNLYSYPKVDVNANLNDSFYVFNTLDDYQVILDSFNYRFKDTILNEGESYYLSLDAVIPGATYQWFRNGEQITDAVLKSYNVQSEGLYFLRLITSEGAFVNSDTINVKYNVINSAQEEDTVGIGYTFPEGAKDIYFPLFFTTDIQSFQIGREINTVEKLREELKYFSFSIHDYPNVYAKISIDSSNYIFPDILEIKSNLNHKNIKSYAYVRKRNVYTNIAFLLIPDKPYGYAGLYYNYPQAYPLAILRQKGNVYISVKPNSDFRAIYSGNKGIKSTSFLADNVNHGRSYYATWFMETVAMAKFLKSIYENVIIIGQGQGGYAALLVSLETSPNACIAINGYSILMDKPYYYAEDDYIIPGLFEYFNKEYIKNKINSMPQTKFLFQFNSNSLLNDEFIKNDAVEHHTEIFLGNGANKFYDYHNITPGTWNYGWDEIGILQFISALQP